MTFTIHRYIFNDMLKTFLLATGVLCLILGLGVMLKPLRQFSVELGHVPQLLLCSLPITLTLVIPIAALLAATLTYGRLSADNEINACQSSGISILTLIYPAATFALLVGFVTLLLAFHVVPAFTAKFDDILKSSAESMIFRNIQKKGNLGDLPGGFSHYQIHADAADPQRRRLTGVVVIEQDDSEGVRFYTAQSVDLDFQPGQGHRPGRIRLIFRDGKRFEQTQDESIITDIEQLTLTADVPSMWKDDVKFKTLNEMRAIQKDMTIFGPVRSLLETFRHQLMIESFFNFCDRKLSQPNHHLDLYTGSDRLRLWARQCRIKQPQPNPDKPKKITRADTAYFKSIEGKSILVDYYYDASLARPDKRFESQKVRLVIDPLQESPSATLWLSDVRLTHAADNRSFNHLNYPITKIVLPAEIIEPAQSYPLQDIINSDHPPLANASSVLDRLFVRLKKTCRKLNAEIEIELQARLAFGVSCIVLVLLGAALGIVMRSGPFLSAFGMSFVPAVLCLATIFTGKHIAEQSSDSITAGILFLWSGILALVVANLVIYRKLMKI